MISGSFSFLAQNHYTLAEINFGGKKYAQTMSVSNDANVRQDVMYLRPKKLSN